MTLLRSRLRLDVVMLIVALAGCGRTGPEVHLVKGAVLLDGKPVEGAVVGFSPTGTAAAWPASGRTRPDGSFRLTTVRGGSPDGGAQIGDYVVTVSKLERLPSDDPLPKFRPLVPLVYGELETSPLRATVRTGVNAGSAFQFELRSDEEAATQPPPDSSVPAP